MDELKSTVMEEGLVLEGMLPLTWRAVEAANFELEIQAAQAGAEEILRYIYSVEEYAADGVEEHDAKPMELARMEVKLNFLLCLASQIFIQYFPLPGARKIKLSAYGVEWVGGDGAVAGQNIVVSLFLSPKCPRPVVLPGKVISVGAVSEDPLIAVQFIGLSATVQGWIEKIIFRHHRRTIALARRTVVPKSE